MVSISGIIDAGLSFIYANPYLFQILCFAFAVLWLSQGLQFVSTWRARRKLTYNLTNSGMKPEEVQAKVNSEHPRKRKRYFAASILTVIALSVFFYILTIYDYLGVLIGVFTFAIGGGLNYYRSGISRASSIFSIAWKRVRHKKHQETPIVAKQPKQESPPRWGATKKFFFAVSAFLITIFVWAGVLLLIKVVTQVEFTELLLSLPFDNLGFILLAIGIGVLLLALLFASFILVLRGEKKLIRRLRK